MDSFYVTITSDEGSKYFPDNRDSAFTVMLGQELNLTPNQWEVGLITFTYPYDFNTVGTDNLIVVRYRENIHEIEIPKWNCPTVESLAAYLDAEMNKKILGRKRLENNKLRPVEIEADAYKRIRFSFDTEDVDLGFAPNTARLLGVSDHKDLSITKFRARQRLRDLIKVGLRDGEKFNHEELEKLQKKMLEDPHYIFTTHFFEEFMACGKQKGSANMKPREISAKESIFQQLIGSETKNPFKAAFEHERSVLGIPGAKKLRFNLEIMSDTQEIENIHDADYLEGFEKRVEEIKKFETKAPRRKHHLDWLQKTINKNMFNFEELDTFIARFEENLNEEDRTYYEGSENAVSYSGLYTEAVATFISGQFLQRFKMTSPVLYGNQKIVLDPFELLYIYTDLTRPEPIGDVVAPLLEIIRTEGTPGSLSQYRAHGHIQYKHLEKSNITNIHILIASKDSEPIPFLRGPTQLQLHFRKKTQRFNR
jgi:hypothetical protein